MDEDDWRTVTKLRVPEANAVDGCGAGGLRWGQRRGGWKTHPERLRVCGVGEGESSEYRKSDEKAAHWRNRILVRFAGDGMCGAPSNGEGIEWERAAT